MKTIPKLMNNALFGKATENVTKHTNIKLETTERRINHFASESNYHTTKFFTKDLLAKEITNIKC